MGLDVLADVDAEERDNAPSFVAFNLGAHLAPKI